MKPRSMIIPTDMLENAINAMLSHDTTAIEASCGELKAFFDSYVFKPSEDEPEKIKELLDEVVKKDLDEYEPYKGAEAIKEIAENLAEVTNMAYSFEEPYP